mmetsp:Transcript_21743/g.19263  ORF Transcript_21743/g.19263 Transcript_21743/m.19263 type:complete len:133 (-) Transcript_21743:20-418(-)
MFSLRLSRPKHLFQVQKFYMSSVGHKRYFLIRYNYAEDGYYRRLGELKRHQAHLEDLKSSGESRLISTHFFPYSGKLMLLETREDEESVRGQVEKDPYITNGKIVEDYQVEEFDFDSIRDFGSISSQFLERP